MANESKFRKDGGPDGRGHAEGSRSSQFAPNDGRKRPGRSKGAKSLGTIYREVAQLPVAAVINGKTKRISTVEAVVMKQREKALKGEERSTDRFLGRLDQFSPPEVQLDLTATLLEEDAELLAAALGRGAIGWLWAGEAAASTYGAAGGDADAPDPGANQQGDDA